MTAERARGQAPAESGAGSAVTRPQPTGASLEVLPSLSRPPSDTRGAEPGGDVSVPAGAPPLSAPAFTLSLRGRAPARSPYELAALLRRAGEGAGLPEPVLERLAAGTGAWLQGERRSSTATQAGYIREVAWWLTWVIARGLDPLDPDHMEADLYAAALRSQGLKDATRARRLSAVSSWYAYLHRIGLAARNPFGRGMERPRVGQYSTTRGLSREDMEQMLAYARARESRRTIALLSLMFSTGCRVGSVIEVTVGALGHDSGHRTIDLPVKGGTTKRFVLPPVAAEAIDDYLRERQEETGRGTGGLEAAAPLFATRNGRRIDQPYVFRLVRRVAAASGVPGADRLSPHSIRHGVATALLDGHALHVVQDFLGHANPATTRRYDEDRESLDRSPAYELGRALSRGADRHRSRFEQRSPS